MTGEPLNSSVVVAPAVLKVGATNSVVVVVASPTCSSVFSAVSVVVGAASSAQETKMTPVKRMIRIKGRSKRFIVRYLVSKKVFL